MWVIDRRREQTQNNNDSEDRDARAGGDDDEIAQFHDRHQYRDEQHIDHAPSPDQLDQAVRSCAVLTGDHALPGAQGEDQGEFADRGDDAK